jgi:hypothetical protein
VAAAAEIKILTVLLAVRVVAQAEQIQQKQAVPAQQIKVMPEVTRV